MCLGLQFDAHLRAETVNAATFPAFILLLLLVSSFASLLLCLNLPTFSSPPSPFLFEPPRTGQIRANKLDPEVIGDKYNKLRDWHHEVSAKLLNV